MKATSRWRRLKNEDDPKYEDDLKYEDSLKYKDDLKYEDYLKYKYDLYHELGTAQSQLVLHYSQILHLGKVSFILGFRELRIYSIL